MPNAREHVIDKLRADACPELVLRTFLHYYDQLVSGATGMIDRTMIRPLESADDIERLPDASVAGRAALPRTVVLKLNGGLGTSMGLERAKSLLPARAGKSFLEIIAGQVLALRRQLGCSLPLLFMNSFSTDEDTLRELARWPELERGQNGIPLSFLQHRIPKIRQDNLAPVEWSADPEKEWCPPGHGDLYTAMITTGILDRLLAAGFEYMFVSNSDNLGATLDPRILGYFAQRRLPFLMEVADRTEADRKGGHVALRAEGGLLLRESAQCPDDETSEFQDIRVYRYFNTNNLWIHLPALQSMLRTRKGVLGLPLIRNAKTVDPADKKSTPVYQLETAMGAALAVFDGASVLRVPRTRFAPVKTTEDLLALWSDCFILDEAMNVRPNPARRHGAVVIRLDPDHYRRIADFLARFEGGAPSLLDCTRLDVKGDVRFGPGVRVRGVATVEAPPGETREVRDCTLGQ